MPTQDRFRWFELISIIFTIIVTFVGATWTVRGSYEKEIGILANRIIKLETKIESYEIHVNELLRFMNKGDRFTREDGKSLQTQIFELRAQQERHVKEISAYLNSPDHVTRSEIITINEKLNDFKYALYKIKEWQELAPPDWFEDKVEMLEKRLDNHIIQINNLLRLLGFKNEINENGTKGK